MTTRAWLLALGTGLVGFVAGWMVAAPADVPVAAAYTPQTQGPPHEAGPAFTSQGTISLDDVRRVVREELAAADTRTAPGARGAPDASEPEPPTPAQTAALARAGMVLDGALSRRQFTEADVDALRAEFHQLAPAQQAEIMQRYAVAVNQGRIVPQTDRIPF